MELAFNSDNSRELFRLIHTTGVKRPGFSETIEETDGSMIFDKQRRLGRWAEHFEEQFSWSSASIPLPVDLPQSEPWSVDMGPPSETEVRQEIYLI